MKIQVIKRTGQVTVTIPRFLAHALDLKKGSEVEFKFEKGKWLFVKKE